MNRSEAVDYLNQNIKSSNLLKHCYAVEAVMRRLAVNFREDEERWALAGLLHDIDYEQTKDNENQHSLVGGQMLQERGLDEEIVNAVIAHNEVHNISRETRMAKALFCADPVTGLIVASALVLPGKNLASVTVENVLNRFKEKSFARGANRETISKCNELDLTLEQFIKMSLETMKLISNELDL